MELSPQAYHELAEIIRRESGIVLGPDKAYLVRHRLEPLVCAKGLNGFDDLLKRLRMGAGMDLRDAIIDAITVKETRFFRDQGCFDGLLKEVLPELPQSLDKSDGGRRGIRVWSAATATGQEAYSVAMLVREYLAAHRNGPDDSHFSILASDISGTAIEAAAAGRYTSADVHRGLSEARLHQHLHQRGEKWHVNEPVHRMVQFRVFNLLHSPAPLGAFDLILCRNVLIYFDDATRRKICRQLYSVLHDGGWLVLGSAESFHGMEEHFETLIHGRSILYRKPGARPCPSPYLQPRIRKPDDRSASRPDPLFWRREVPT